MFLFPSLLSFPSSHKTLLKLHSLFLSRLQFPLFILSYMISSFFFTINNFLISFSWFLSFSNYTFLNIFSFSSSIYSPHHEVHISASSVLFLLPWFVYPSFLFLCDGRVVNSWALVRIPPKHINFLKTIDVQIFSQP